MSSIARARTVFIYAHLDHFADQIHEGGAVARGDVIGYVGSTGDALPDAPQLHFAILRLGADKKWWKGEAIDPYPILMRSVRKRTATRFERPVPSSLARSCPEARSHFLPLALLASSG